ncbi:MAG: hypothetical protein ACREJC_11075, partial [Tepidisphaeraceae bacterium]
LWARTIAPQRTAMISVLLAATYPGAIFFCAALTEGPFFMFVAIGLWLLQRKQFWWAAAVSGIATALRPTGVALAMTVAAYAMYCASGPWTARILRTAVISLVSVSGLLAYQSYIWNRYHRFDAYLVAQQDWERQDKEANAAERAGGGPERYSLEFFLDRIYKPQAWNRGIALVLTIVLVAGMIRPGPVPRVLFVLPLVILLLSAVPNNMLRASSIFRYESAGLPLFVVLAMWFSAAKRRHWLVGLLAVQLAVQVYYAFLFSRGIWVG